MTFIFEVSGPLQLKFGRFKSQSMVRFWWLWFAFGWLRVPFKEFSQTAYDWSEQ